MNVSILIQYILFKNKYSNYQNKKQKKKHITKLNSGYPRFLLSFINTVLLIQ